MATGRGRGAQPRLRPLGVVAAALMLGSSLVPLAPTPVGAIPTVVLTLSVKPTWVEFGGTFTLTATVTPSEPVTGLIRVSIFAENGLPAYGHMHGCTPACSLEYPGLAEFEFDGLTSKATIKALWTDEGQRDDPTWNRFNVGISVGDVNYAPHDWVKGYIGAPPATPTPRPTRRPTPVPTQNPAATQVPTVTAPPPPPLATVEVEPSTALASPAVPSSPPATSQPPLESGLQAPSSAEPAIRDTAAISPPAISALALAAFVVAVLAGWQIRRSRAGP